MTLQFRIILFLFCLIPTCGLAQIEDDYNPESPFVDPADILTLFNNEAYIREHRIKRIRIVQNSRLMGKSTKEYSFNENGQVDSLILRIGDKLTNVYVYENGLKREHICYKEEEHFRYTREGIFLDSLLIDRQFILRQYEYDQNGFLSKEINAENDSYKSHDSICYVNDSLGRPVEINRWKNNKVRTEQRKYNTLNLITESVSKGWENEPEQLQYNRYRKDGRVELIYYGPNISSAMFDLSKATLADTLILYRISNSFNLYDYDKEGRLTTMILAYLRPDFHIENFRFSYDKNGLLDTIITRDVFTHNSISKLKLYSWNRSAQLTEYREFHSSPSLSMWASEKVIFKKSIEYNSNKLPKSIVTKELNKFTSEVSEKVQLIYYEFYP